MKQIFFLLITAFIFASCSSKPELTNEFLEGDWVCFDAEIFGEGISEQQQNVLKQISVNSVYSFKDSTINLSSQYLSFEFTYELFVNEDTATITLIPQGRASLKKTIYGVVEYTEDVFIIRETNPYYSSTTYLQRKQN